MSVPAAINENETPPAFALSDNTEPKDHLCPKDGSKMRRFNYAFSSDIPIDQCEVCGAVWLDAHELKDVRKHLTELENDTLDAAVAELALANTRSERLTGTDLALVLIAPYFALPYADTKPNHKVRWATLSLIVLNCVVFTLLVFPRGEKELETLFSLFAFSPAYAFEPTMFFRYLSSMFLHGSWLHLIGNMMFLWVFGNELEKELSLPLYVSSYLVSGVVASIAFTATASPTALAVGASGAISGLMGLYLVIHPKMKLKIFYFIPAIQLRIVTGRLRVPAWWYIVVWFVLQFVYQLVFGDSSNVAYSAHLGGFIAGLALGVMYFIFAPKVTSTPKTLRRL